MIKMVKKKINKTNNQEIFQMSEEDKIRYLEKEISELVGENRILKKILEQKLEIELNPKIIF